MKETGRIARAARAVDRRVVAASGRIATGAGPEIRRSKSRWRRKPDESVHDEPAG